MKNWSSGLLLGIAILLILFGLFTIFNPGSFWGIVNILLGIALIFSGVSVIICAIKSKQTQYVSFLFVIGILGVTLGIILAGASEANFVGKLMVWMFALWAFVRGGTLIFFEIQNKSTRPLWWGISVLGGILILLAILTAISSGVLANLVGIFIGISIMFDGISLIFFAFNGGGAKTIQVQLISQNNQIENTLQDVTMVETHSNEQSQNN